MIEASLLPKILRYEPETGELFWRERPVEMFRDGGHVAAHSAAKWNARYAGKEAFTATGSNEYQCGCIANTQLTAHRVIWALHYGEWPKNQIDHINGDRRDNRIRNLRMVTNAENGRNQKRRTTNTSGVTGVYLFKNAGKWQASICVDGRQIHIGYFDKFDDAVTARKAAEKRFGFHENHGREAA